MSKAKSTSYDLDDEPPADVAGSRSAPTEPSEAEIKEKDPNAGLERVEDKETIRSLAFAGTRLRAKSMRDGEYFTIMRHQGDVVLAIKNDELIAEYLAGPVFIVG